MSLSFHYQPQWNNETKEYCDIPNLFKKFSKNNKTFWCPCGMHKRHFDTAGEYKKHIEHKKHQEFLVKKTCDELRSMRMKERNKRKDAEMKLEVEQNKVKENLVKNLEFDKEIQCLHEGFYRDMEEIEERYQEGCNKEKQMRDRKKEARINKLTDDISDCKRKRDEQNNL